MADEVSAYLDFHPFKNFNQDKWDERNAIVDGAFHAPEVYLTPLVGHTLTMPPGVDHDQWWFVKTEIRPSHINHNTIGRTQRMTTPIYFDVRQRKVRARQRWGAKSQWDEYHSLVTRWGDDTPGFIAAALRDQLAANIVGQTEKVCRDGLITHALHTYMYDGTPFEEGVADFSSLPDDETGIFDVTMLEHVALRLATRSENSLKKWGSYAQPVPGQNFRQSVLILSTTGTYWGIQNSPESDYMVDLRSLQDERIINGGKVMYRDFATIVDTGAGALVLYNAGNITAQVAVTEPINFGDGAPDPETESVDGMYWAGQGGENAQHYVQCSDLGTDQFVKGDFISIHVKRTDDWGIPDGNDFLDGKTYVAEIYEVDEVNERLVLRDPLTEEYVTPAPYTTLNDVAVTGNAYAFITKGAHVHPVMIFGTREGCQFVKRTQPDGSFIRYHRPSDAPVDYPSIERVTANWRGEVNPWNLDIYEIIFCNAPWANRGSIQY